jgi:branched-subunit amino acid transport system permease
LGVPNIFLLWIAIGLVAVWFLSATAWGGKVFSTGANARVALLSATHVQLVKISVYAISGFIAALSGFCLIGYVGAAFLGLRDAYVLSSIVVAVMGGMSLAGGRIPYRRRRCGHSDHGLNQPLDHNADSARRDARSCSASSWLCSCCSIAISIARAERSRRVENMTQPAF